jgi:hypothetical protein
MNITPAGTGKIAAGSIALAAITVSGALSIAASASAGPAAQDPPCVATGPFCVDPSGLGIPPKDAIAVDVHQSPISVSINVKNTSKLDGNCTYNAHPTNNPLLPPVHRDFNLSPDQATTLDFPAPPPLATYHLVIACHGTFNGTDDEFGHFEQDVTGGA